MNAIVTAGGEEKPGAEPRPESVPVKVTVTAVLSAASATRAGVKWTFVSALPPAG